MIVLMAGILSEFQIVRSTFLICQHPLYDILEHTRGRLLLIYLKMSVTTTYNPASTELHRTLNDYQLHLTGVSQEHDLSAGRAPQTKRVIKDGASQPPNWPQNYRDVPPYRPINRHLDWAERPSGSNPIEVAFVTSMLHGVWLNAVSIHLEFMRRCIAVPKSLMCQL